MAETKASPVLVEALDIALSSDKLDKRVKASSLRRVNFSPLQLHGKSCAA